MPVRRSNYTRDWPETSRRKRDAAGRKCQDCFAPDSARIIRNPANSREWVRYDKEKDCWCDPAGNVVYNLFTRKPITVCLSVGHLDQDSKNDADENLRVWCQCCHLNFDRPWNLAKMARKRALRDAIDRRQLSMRLI